VALQATEAAAMQAKEVALMAQQDQLQQNKVTRLEITKLEANPELFQVEIDGNV
jgi:hypothetical protein